MVHYRIPEDVPHLLDLRGRLRRIVPPGADPDLAMTSILASEVNLRATPPRRGRGRPRSRSVAHALARMELGCEGYESARAAARSVVANETRGRLLDRLRSRLACTIQTIMDKRRDEISDIYRSGEISAREQFFLDRYRGFFPALCEAVARIEITPDEDRVLARAQQIGREMKRRR